MNQLSDDGIILARTNFGEADRIMTVLTAAHGKIRVIAKGVRREKSKLAGGIELFSVSELAYIKGRGDIDTLVSARLIVHYGTIARDLPRTMFAYDALKRINKITEDEPGREFFDLAWLLFTALNDLGIDLKLVEFWFFIQLLSHLGRAPNVLVDIHGGKLEATGTYQFDIDGMGFFAKPDGPYGADHIKLLRLTAHNPPSSLAHIQGVRRLVADLLQVVGLMVQHL